MEFWGINVDWAVFSEPGAYRTWMLICAGISVLALVWITALLTRGGFDDLNEIIRSPRATAAARMRARASTAPRSLLMLLAAAIGAISIAAPLFFQGVVIIFVWRQIFG
ncbi:MAG: hypothetical protein JJU18_09630 [Oceanicaulis sp.]|nr:hypothetical protein [Oceanicaulis sp.]